MANLFFAVYQPLIAAALVLGYFTNIPLWIDARTGAGITPTLYIAIILAPLPFVLRERTSIVTFFAHPYVWWGAFMFLLHSLGYIRSEYFVGSIEDVAVQIDRFRNFLLAPAFAYLVYAISQTTYRPFLLILIVVGPLMVLYGFIDPGFFAEGRDAKTITAGRSGGPWFNSNIAAEALLLALLMARKSAPKVLFVAAFVLAGAAIITTGSRAGMLGWLALGAVFIANKELPKAFLATPLLLIVFYSSILIFVEDIVTSIPEQAAGAENLLARLEFLSGDVSADEGGGDERGSLLINALTESMERPILGHGYDFADSQVQTGAGSHNMLAQLWYIHGVLGIIAWLSLAYILWRYGAARRWINPPLFMFLWFTLFNHNLIEHNIWFIFFAFTFFDKVKSPQASSLARKNVAKVSIEKGPKRKRRKRSNKNSLSGGASWR